MGRIEGRVLAGATPRQGATVYVTSGQAVLGEMSTDTQGRFSTTVPLDVECELHASTAGGESAEAVHLFAGAEVSMFLTAPATLRGTVHGAPRVFVVDVPELQREEVFVAKDGAWKMSGLFAGTMTVRAIAPGLIASTEVPLAAGDVRTVDLHLAPPPREPSDRSPGVPDPTHEF
jgi:hypothetical protein